MDPLSDLLRVIRLDGAYFFAVEAAGPFSVETVAARELSPRILPDAEHLISYHILTEGRCYGGVLGEEQIELLPGDVLIFPHGDAHVMSSERAVRLGPDVYKFAPARYPDTVVIGRGGPGARRSSAGSSAATAVPSIRCWQHFRGDCTLAACRTVGTPASPASSPKSPDSGDPGRTPYSPNWRS